jgi:hypothetical protein
MFKKKILNQVAISISPYNETFYPMSTTQFFYNLIMIMPQNLGQTTKVLCCLNTYSLGPRI